MRYFKSKNGEIRAISPDQEKLIASDWVELDEQQFVAEVEARRPKLTPEENRDYALANLVHDLGEGRLIQIRPFPFSSDEANIRNAIERMQRMGQPKQPWKMADDSISLLSAEELQQAIESGQDQTAQIWSDYFAAIAG